MRFVLVAVLFFCSTSSVMAYVPVFPEFETQRDVYRITDPSLMQMFFGELKNSPHTYEITSVEPFKLSIELGEPSLDTGKENIASIVIKIPEKKARVEEVVRIPAPPTWTEYFDSMTAESYKRGGSFEKELPPGTYRVEVHTPDNLEKYVLKIGDRDEMTIGYFDLLGRLVRVQHFFGDTFLGVLLSPYVYLPVLFLLFLLYIGYRTRAKWYTKRI